MGPFILLAMLKNIIQKSLFKTLFPGMLFLLIIPRLHAEEFSLEIKPGDLINFFALKKNIYERNKEKIIQAEGNVVIIHQNSTIYGDECLMNFTTGHLEIHGNVRLVGKELNLYGTDIYYNAKTKLFNIENAKLFTAKYSVVAKKIIKIDNANYLAEESEFTTCVDCPESWSIFASKIHITVNEYVKAKNAMFKIKGSDSFYLPYVVFPIKKERESGLLFPSFGTRFAQGFVFEQPYFWNISPSQDLTFTPGFWTKRGYSSHLEYRWMFDHDSWIKFDNTYMNDRIYLPNKENDDSSGTKYFRYFHLADMGYRPSNNMNFQISYTDFRDLDMYREFNQILSEKINSAETGLDAFFYWRNSWSELNVQALIPNSLLRANEDSDRNIFDRDPKAVATLPKLMWDIPSTQFLWSGGSLLPLMIMKLDTETATFSQNHSDGETVFRNAQRTILSPQVKVFWWNGDIVELSSTINQDYAHYDFRNDSVRNFDKMQIKAKSSLTFEVAKVYGVSSVRPATIMSGLEQSNDIKPVDNKAVEAEHQLITALPDWHKKIGDEEKLIMTPSYRHVAKLALNHHYLFQEELSGNEQFGNHLKSLGGWFDYRDALLEQDYAIASEEFQTIIPTVNTLELAWDNQLIRKSPKVVDFNQDFLYNQDQFTFGNIAFLNFSQGLRLKKRQDEDNFRESLTRLKTQIGSSLSPYFQISLTDYYFHQNYKHIWSLALVNQFTRVKLAHGLDYNEFNNRKDYRLQATYQVNDLLELVYNNNRDLANNISLTQSYGFNYNSSSKCWMMDLMYLEALKDKQIRFDFVFYFGDQAVGK